MSPSEPSLESASRGPKAEKKEKNHPVYPLAMPLHILGRLPSVRALRDRTANKGVAAPTTPRNRHRCYTVVAWPPARRAVRPWRGFVSWIPSSSSFPDDVRRRPSSCFFVSPLVRDLGSCRDVLKPLHSQRPRKKDSRQVSVLSLFGWRVLCFERASA